MMERMNDGRTMEVDLRRLAQPPAIARFSVLGQIACFHPDLSNPLTIDEGFSRVLKSREPPYSRPGWRVPLDWTELDFGWLKGQKVSCFVLENLEGRAPAPIPTEAEKLVLEACTAELLFFESEFNSRAAPHIVVPPRESCRFQLSSKLAVRGRARVTLTVFPE